MSTSKQKLSKREALRRRRTQQKRIRDIILIVGGILIISLTVWGIASNFNAEQNPDNEAQTPAPNAPAATFKQYDAQPEMMIDVEKEYYATIKMAKGGEIVIQLYPDKAPMTVNNFVFLAREGYYDNTTFHRVLEGFMAQAGDPTGTGGGGPGYRFEDEISDLNFDQVGLIAMANSGPNTNGSQFFITFAPTEWLNGRHTIFGQVIEGMDVALNITLRDPQNNPQFDGDMIESITIEEK